MSEITFPYVFISDGLAVTIYKHEVDDALENCGMVQLGETEEERFYIALNWCIGAATMKAKIGIHYND